MSPEKHDLAVEAAKTAPAAIGTALAAMTLNHWIAAATFAYIVVQIAYLLRKWFREESDWARRMRRKRADETTSPGDL